jgi:carboxymethylenebutenolidase
MITTSSIAIATGDGATLRAHVAVPAAGAGPGLLLLSDGPGDDASMLALARRHAEEGYLCLAPDLHVDPASGARDPERALRAVADALAALRRHPACNGRAGAVGYGAGGLLAALGAARLDLDCAVAYYPTGLETHCATLTALRCPLIVHLGGMDARLPPAAQATIAAAVADLPGATCHVYAGCGHGFADPAHAAHERAASTLAGSRSIALLRAAIGPAPDLERLWERHTELEFAARDVDATMATMVAEPYVNHVPTMTGGVGHDHLKRFYKYHFVEANPPDTRLIPVSRTVGPDRLVDEMVFCFTHTCEIPWMLPGIAPTGRYVEVPLVAIVTFRGDKLCHEHIYWDQASVLVQIGKLDPAGLPVAGAATARKLLDPALPSNELMAGWAGSAGKPL